jgi:hypothetical protein
MWCHIQDRRDLGSNLFPGGLPNRAKTGKGIIHHSVVGESSVSKKMCLGLLPVLLMLYGEK